MPDDLPPVFPEIPEKEDSAWVTTSFQLPAELRTWLKAEAKKRRTSMGMVINHLIRGGMALAEKQAGDKDGEKK